MSRGLSRRQLLRSTLALPFAGAGLAGAAAAAGQTAARAIAPPPATAVNGPITLGAGSSLYQRLGVRTHVNAYGTLTTLSGSLMPAEVREAMYEASNHFVQIHDLQARVGERLAALTGSEAAFVTAGASASLCLATCAVTAGDDPAKIDRLPDLTGMKSEIVIQKVHRNSYDHAFRMVGVKLVEVETAEDIRRAVNDRTAAFAMVLSHNSLGHRVSLEEMIGLAHDRGLPLILDAAAEIPPADNLSRFVRMGADFVAFSGGKNLRGPQASGILMGKKAWIEKAYANSAPHNRFARIAKVGKEEIVGLLAAVEHYLFRRDHVAERREYYAMLDRVAGRLRDVPTVVTEYITNDDYSHSPRLSVQWDEQTLGVTLDQMMDRLLNGEPSIVATDMTRYRPNWKRGIGIFAYNLQPGEELIVADRVTAILSGQA